jgi:UDP-N-acetylmuramoylalanine--D-glutamate ligase
MQDTKVKRRKITESPNRKKLLEIKDKNVTVVGLARSGIGAANLLSELGAHVTVTDIKTEEDLRESSTRLNPSVRLALGSHPEDIFIHADIVVVSPGVSLDIRPLRRAKSEEIPVFGELELAYQIAADGLYEPILAPLMKKDRGGFLAVTGTNGKSTTTALLAFMMKRGGYKTIVGGNIGNALTEEILKRYIMQDSPSAPLDYIVVEVSSFQLETIKNFRPKVAALVNITPDHLDRYRSLEEYRNAKARIFENQAESDFLVLNRDDPETMRVDSEKLKVKHEKPRVFYLSRKQKVEGLYFKDGIIYCSIPDLPHVPVPLPLIKALDIKIKGVHNLENAMAASAMALLAGCPVEAVADSLKEFPGLEHRLEFVRELDGVSYFNDSKGTNVGAVIKSLESFSEPIVLIAGGRDKAGDFYQLRDLVKERVKSLVLIGEAREKIKHDLGDLTDTIIAKDLRDAVNISRNTAEKGDIVLLSPACASFDMFDDFEDRGRQFKAIVKGMNNVQVR